MFAVGIAVAVAVAVVGVVVARGVMVGPVVWLVVGPLIISKSSYESREIFSNLSQDPSVRAYRP